MALTEIQEKIAKTIVQVFETGSLENHYSTAVVMKGDTGRLSYGKAQTTLASGNLYLLLKDYVEAKGQYADFVSGWLDRIRDKAPECDTDRTLMLTLAAAGKDPIMQRVQDEFFDRVYWDRAETTATGMGFVLPLSYAVVYDSFVHGSWKLIRDRVNNKYGSNIIDNAGEMNWITRYLHERSLWLSSHSNMLLRKTIYRMQAFQKLISDNNWNLNPPMRINGVAITAETFMDKPQVVHASAEDESDAVLMITTPRTTGPEVVKLQEALIKLNFYPFAPNGIYDDATEDAVEGYQQSRRLKADGIVGPITRSKIFSEV